MVHCPVLWQHQQKKLKKVLVLSLHPLVARLATDASADTPMDRVPLLVASQVLGVCTSPLLERPSIVQRSKKPRLTTTGKRKPVLVVALFSRPPWASSSSCTLRQWTLVDSIADLPVHAFWGVSLPLALQLKGEEGGLEEDVEVPS